MSENKTTGSTEGRRYTVREIDALRNVVEMRWLFGTSAISEGPNFSHSHKESEKVKCVEEILRTHMIAGHTAEDLITTDRERQLEWERKTKRHA